MGVFICGSLCRGPDQEVSSFLCHILSAEWLPGECLHNQLVSGSAVCFSAGPAFVQSTNKGAGGSGIAHSDHFRLAGLGGSGLLICWHLEFSFLLATCPPSTELMLWLYTLRLSSAS